MSKLNDITGKRFGRLTALSFERAYYANRMQVLWTCKCDCGKMIRSASHALKRGNPKSCGCWNDEETAARNKTHGMCHSLTYNNWTAMRQRCNDPNVINYRNYGGRGIKVCKRWSKFENFLADMGERPTPNHELDRKDNDGDYTPSNCQWSDKTAQGGNKRNNVRLTWNGITKTVAQWARSIGIDAAVIRRRLGLGWSHSKVLSTPVKQSSRV